MGGFQHLPRELANVNALKNMLDRYYCIKTENICYISRYFLHYLVPPFSPMSGERNLHGLYSF